MSDGDLTQVSAEHEGRILTGVGVKTEDLERTMERHTEEPSEKATPEPVNGAEASTSKTRGAKRFDELTAEREAAKTRADSAEKERDELRAKLAQPRAEKEPASAAIVAPAETKATAAPLTEARKKPSEDEVGTKYTSYADFAEDLADWKIEERFKSFDLDGKVKSGIEADRASRSMADHVQTLYEKARKAYPDFDAVIQSGPGSEVDFSPDPVVANARLHTILRLPHAEHILYALGKDATETARLAKLSDVEFGLALARFSPTETSVAPPASTGLRSVIAPPPYQPVGTGSKTTVLPSSALPSKAGYDFDKSGYREKRAQERGLKNRR